MTLSARESALGAVPGRTHGSVPTIVPKRTITTIVSVGHGRKNQMNLSARESALGAEKAPSVLANCGVLRMEHFHLLSRGKQSHRTVFFSLAFESPQPHGSNTNRDTHEGYPCLYGANEGIRTPDLLITNQLRYRLRHISVVEIFTTLILYTIFSQNSSAVLNFS